MKKFYVVALFFSVYYEGLGMMAPIGGWHGGSFLRGCSQVSVDKAVTLVNSLKKLVVSPLEQPNLISARGMKSEGFTMHPALIREYTVAKIFLELEKVSAEEPFIQDCTSNLIESYNPSRGRIIIDLDAFERSCLDCTKSLIIKEKSRVE